MARNYVWFTQWHTASAATVSSSSSSSLTNHSGRAPLPPRAQVLSRVFLVLPSCFPTLLFGALTAGPPGQPPEAAGAWGHRCSDGRKAGPCLVLSRAHCTHKCLIAPVWPHGGRAKAL